MRRYVFRLVLVTLAVLGSSTVRADDQQIAQQIIERFQAAKKDGSLKGFSMDLQVDEGTVWLSGRVANEEQQAKALDIARRIKGVKQVVNDLSIGAPAAKQTPVPRQPSVPRQAGNDGRQIAAAPKQTTPSAAGRTVSAPQKLVSAVGQYFAQRREQPAAEEPTPGQSAGAGYETELAGATSPIGSGLDPAASSRRQTVVQAAQPVAGVPQAVANANLPQAGSLQPMPYAQALPYVQPVPAYAGSRSPVPLAMAPATTINYQGAVNGAQGAPVPLHMAGSGVGIAPARYDHPSMPGYAWPSYAAYPNYAAVTYPKQYSPSAWPYIGPFYPYPQVPLGWRKVTLEWDDGWWMLDFKDRRTMYNH